MGNTWLGWLSLIALPDLFIVIFSPSLFTETPVSLLFLVRLAKEGVRPVQLDITGKI
jgi:hypothetical protein